MNAIQLRALRNGITPPLAHGQPSRFGGLSEYGQPGYARDSDLPTQDSVLPPLMKAANWKELVDDARRAWPRLTWKDLEWVDGDFRSLASLIQLAFPISSAETRQQARDFFEAHGTSQTTITESATLTAAARPASTDSARQGQKPKQANRPHGDRPTPTPHE